MHVQWLAGFSSVDSRYQPRWLPSGSQQAKDFWLVGYSPDEVHSAHADDTTVTFVGNCLISQAELRQAPTAARNQQWQTLVGYPGTYVTVVQQHRRVSVFGGLSGASRIYFVVDERGDCWWANAATPLASLLGAEADLELLALDLAIDGFDICGGRAPFRGVQVVPPGSMLCLQPGSSLIRSWHTPSYSLSFDEAVDKLRSSLLQSMERRLALPNVLSSDFSGGLDSSTLVWLAAREREIHGITYTHPQMPSDDLLYATTLASESPLIRHSLLEGDETTAHYSDLNGDLPLTDLPAADASLASYNRAKLALAVQAGSTHYLNGVAGDNVLDAPNVHMVERYAAGQRLHALTDAYAFARLRTCSPLRTFLAIRSVARTSYADDVRDAALSLRRQLFIDLAAQPWQTLRWVGLTKSAAWLSPQTRDAVADRIEELAAGFPSEMRSAVFVEWNALRRIAMGRQLMAGLAREQGITLHTPYLDAGVVSAGLSLPPFDRVGRGRFKPLLGAAMHEYVPDRLLNRRTKGEFSGVMHQGLRVNQETVRDLTTRSRLVADGLLDGHAVEHSVQRAINGLKAPLAGIQRLAVTEIWLRQQSRNKKERWWVQC